jgi:surfactin synthase thioesterase subunit
VDTGAGQAGTVFYDRMATWPLAFELGVKEAIRRHFPESEYAVFVTGHSMGGSLVFMMCQRVANIAGVNAAKWAR